MLRRCLLSTLPGPAAARLLSFPESLLTGELLNASARRNVLRSKELWNQMDRLGLPKSAICYNALIRVHLHRNDLKTAYNFLLEMEEKNVQPDQETFNLLLARFATYQSLHHVTQNLLNLAMHKYGMPESETFTFVDCCLRMQSKDLSLASLLYQRLWVNGAPQSGLLENLILQASQCDLMFPLFLQVLSDVFRHSLYIRSSVWIEILQRSTLVDVSTETGVVRKIFTRVKEWNLDEGLFMRIACFAARCGDLEFGRRIAEQMEKNLGSLKPWNTIPLMQTAPKKSGAEAARPVNKNS